MSQDNPWAAPTPEPEPSAPASGTFHASGGAFDADNRESHADNTPKDTYVSSSQPASETAPQAPSASTQYGANSFWGQPGFSDPFAGGGSDNPLQSTTTWSSSAAAGKRREQPGWFALVGVALAASLLTLGGTYALDLYDNSNDPEATSSTLFNPQDKGVSTPEPVQGSTSQNPDWEAVAAAVRPAVVAISVTGNDGSAQGSGAIIDSGGHILTNNHVVAGADGGQSKIAVELSDGRLYSADIVGRDVITDLAVIKLKDPPRDLTAVALGDSSKLQVGESVAAIGNPLGLSSTVTTGIVSALNRPVNVKAVQGPTQDRQSDDFPGWRELFGQPQSRTQPNSDVTQVTTNAIQIDAAINPGNSGGPLFDAKGRVIGVTSSIASLSESNFGSEAVGGSIGLGFAIPINQASMIANQLIEHGEVAHAVLGVAVNEKIATVGKVSRLGAEVSEVYPGSGAEKSKIKPGDIIVSIDGNQVKGASSLVGWVRQYKVGQAVELGIVRDGKEMKVSVTLQPQ